MIRLKGCTTAGLPSGAPAAGRGTDGTELADAPAGLPTGAAVTGERE